jgi:hypothetical protein
MVSGEAARNRKKESMWRRHLEAQAGSGQSVRSYCIRRGLREHRLYWWRRELGRRDAEKSSAASSAQPAFVPVTVAAHVPACGRIEIVLRDGRRVRVTGPVDRQMLADVLAVLGAGGVAC